MKVKVGRGTSTHVPQKLAMHEVLLPLYNARQSANLGSSQLFHRFGICSVHTWILDVVLVLSKFGSACKKYSISYIAFLYLRNLPLEDTELNLQVPLLLDPASQG